MSEVNYRRNGMKREANKMTPWCDEFVWRFLAWVNGRRWGYNLSPFEDVAAALRTAAAMVLTPGAFSSRDYVLFKLGKDKREEVTEVGLDKIIDVDWSWQFVCVRPQKVEILRDSYSEDGYGKSNWSYFSTSAIRPSGEWVSSNADDDDFVLPDRPIRGVKIVQKGCPPYQSGDIKVSGACLDSLKPSLKRHWSAVSM